GVLFFGESRERKAPYFVSFFHRNLSAATFIIYHVRPLQCKLFLSECSPSGNVVRALHDFLRSGEN
ncbi:hypothetical protein, partial [Paenibacillus darwinianus]|uniref:hypothetical protein n=1 Tax=Paenibacillus darwinianus TaxID=1380763 RepID=UPI001CC004A4